MPAHKDAAPSGKARKAAPTKALRPAGRGRPPRADNRLSLLLDAAAAQFAARGYEAASIRDIVKAVGMLPGSLYYHFANKDELLAAVYGEGVRRISAAVERAVAAAPARDPWAQLEAACAAHLESLLDRSAYAKVVISVQPADVPAAAPALVALRDGYEARFAALVRALPLERRVDRGAMRLFLLGALNWTPTWYRAPHGRNGADPARLAREVVALLRAGA